MTQFKPNTILPFLLAIVFLLWPDDGMSQQPRRRDMVAPGAVLNSDSLAIDTIPRDSVTQDSIQAPRKQPLNAPVIYEANDSIVFEQGGYAHLYGSGKVNYEKIELTSEIITMNMDSSSVYARGRPDSLGVTQGDPVFKDGETPYETRQIRYNFKSKRGLISNVVTQQGEGYVVGNNAKKGANDELFMMHGRYTTCDHHDHPHFYLQLTRAKVRPKKNVVTGPSYLVVEDVPLPLFVPFFFFPFSSSYQSGFIMPSYMDDSARGFGLSGGGYYFAISDKMDARITGDIFTKGSWALGVETNYNVRYKYSGLLQAYYQTTKTGDKGMPDYAVSKDLKVVWSHRQDAKFNPNSTFSASVNYASSSYEQKNIGNLYNNEARSQNTKTSSISYSRSFPDQKLTISSTMNIAQTLRDSSISVTLPDLNISLSRIYPFKRKNRVGEEKWYEKISMGYTGRLTNSITTKDDQLFEKSLVKDWQNGMSHNIPISATFTLFNYFNITLSVTYAESWHTKKITQDWSNEENKLVPTDTIYGFHRVYRYNAALNLNTKLYGMYKPLFLKSKELQIRHVFTPQVSISAAPDFTSPSYGFIKTVEYTDRNGELQQTTYNPYAGQPLTISPSGKQGLINFSMSNNLEMKMKSDSDSTGVKKISLIDEFGGDISYNIAAEERPWSNLNLNLRLKLSKSYTFTMNSTFRTYGYKYDDDGRVVQNDRTEWSYGRFGIFQGWNNSFSYTFNNDTWKKWFGPKEDNEKNKDPNQTTSTEDAENTDGEGNVPTKRVEKATAGADGYQAFKMPWSLSFNYNITISEDTSKPINEKNMRYPYKLTHRLNFSGNIKLSNKWSMNFNSGYDFEAKEISMTTFNISRDLHCFNMVASFSPFGRYKYYNFTIRASAQILQDLKWDQRSQTQSNIRWY